MKNIAINTSLVLFSVNAEAMQISNRGNAMLILSWSNDFYEYEIETKDASKFNYGVIQSICVILGQFCVPIQTPRAPIQYKDDILPVWEIPLWI